MKQSLRDLRVKFGLKEVRIVRRQEADKWKRNIVREFTR